MVIGIGETVLDIIFRDNQPQTAVPGGSTFNAIISLGRMGVDCAIVTEVGDDHVGDITCKYLRDNHVSDLYVCRHIGSKSHISLAFLDENNDAHYQFYKDHAHAHLQVNTPAFQEQDIVLFGSFFAINPVIRETVYSLLQAAKRAGAILYYDINFRKAHMVDIPDVIGNICENMRLSDVVRGSVEDFEYLYGTRDIETIYHTHIAPYCKNWICTRGGEKIILRTPTIQTEFAVPPIHTISTIGAGDNFNAGFIYELMKLKHLPFTIEEWASLIATGQCFAQNVCQQWGNSVRLEK